MLHHIIMEKLERKHYLKHYLGGPAMVLSPEENRTGQIEEIDMEDGSTLIKSGIESHWVEPDHVTPSLKQFKDLSTEDIHCIIQHLDFGSIKISESEIMKINKMDNGGVIIYFMRGDYIVISDNWAIFLKTHRETFDQTIMPFNTGTIIFLLCELGYDVTGLFKK